MFIFNIIGYVIMLCIVIGALYGMTPLGRFSIWASITDTFTHAKMAAGIFAIGAVLSAIRF